jgi:hypothetical protein
VELNNDYNRSVSEVVSIVRGVPQGTILGPILFALYSTDMIGCVKNCKYQIYADDTQLYLSFDPRNTVAAVKMICDDLNRIDQWARDNCLVLNPIKSKFLV